MAEAFLGEIRMFSSNVVPSHWALCNGQLISISQNSALFSLLGTYYGGNGVNTFALPDLRGRVPVHNDTSLPIGTAGGQEAVTLIPGELPSHSHSLVASADSATTVSPGGKVPGTSARRLPYTESVDSVMANSAVSTAGGGQPHENRMPTMACNFIICMNGIFPSR